MTGGEKRSDDIIAPKLSVGRPEVHAGILKDKETADLENAIVDTLKNLNARLTKKEIMALMNRIEVGTGLE